MDRETQVRASIWLRRTVSKAEDPYALMSELMDRLAEYDADLQVARAEDPRPCQGIYSNICVAEGCYNESCLKE